MRYGSELSDFELIRELSNCNAEDRNEIYLILYDRYKNLVLKVAYTYLRDYDRAGDLMHDVFVRVIETVGTLRNPHTFKSWIMKITRNLCVDSLRKTSLLTSHVDAEIEVSCAERFEDCLIAGMEKKRILEPLSDCIGQLEEFDLSVFELRWQGLKSAQLCKIFTKDKQQIRRSYDRIKKVLESCMHKKGFRISIDQIIQMGELDE